MDKIYSFLKKDDHSREGSFEGDVEGGTPRNRPSSFASRSSSTTLLPPSALAMEMRDMHRDCGRASTSSSSPQQYNRQTPSPLPSRKARIEYTEALKIWKRYRNVDRLLELIYDYYRGSGRLPIMLEKYANLAMVLFVVNFGIFLTYGVDWAFLYRPATAASHPVLWEVVRWPRMPFVVLLAWLAFMGGWVVWLTRTWAYSRELKDIEKIYEGLLGFDASTMRNADFDSTINGLNEVHKEHPLAQGSNLDAYSVCNRLMRRDNYMIALFNKNVLDFTLPLAKHEILTRQLEWNLNICLLGFVFDDRFNVKKRFTRANEKGALSEELAIRFRNMALVNLLLAPVIFVYLVFYFFLRYAEEFYKNPSSLGARSYSRLARWKFREFNELPHYFEDRLDQSHRKSLKFLDQFHNRRVVTVARLVSFLTGSFIAVLLGISFINEDLLMHFELTRGKSPLWYLPILGLVLAFCKAVLPDSCKRQDAKKLISQIIEYTHYSPQHWRDCRPYQIAKEFKRLFRYRIAGIGEDFLGILAVPYLLWFQFSRQADTIIDFFREFTVHVDGLGYVCSFALFEFQRPAIAATAAIKTGGSGGDLEKQPLIGEDEQAQLIQSPILPGKLEKSYLVFRGHHPQAADIKAGEELLERLNEYCERNQQRESADSLMMRKSSIVLGKMLNKQQTNLYAEGDGLAGDEDGAGSPGSEKRGLMSLFDKFYYSSLNK